MKKTKPRFYNTRSISTINDEESRYRPFAAKLHGTHFERVMKKETVNAPCKERPRPQFHYFAERINDTHKKIRRGFNL